MAFSKKTYTSGQTTITADNLNAIQDELIRVGGAGTSPVADYVVEQGTSGIWTYRKWASGAAECWLESNLFIIGTTPVAYMNGSAYYSYATFDLPFTFTTRPRIVAEGNLGSGMGFVNFFSEDGSRSVTAYVTGNEESAEITIHSMIVIGRWK